MVSTFDFWNFSSEPAIEDSIRNFIVNQGGAKAVDVLALMDQVRARAQKDRGIDLEPEVIVVGEDE